ncbi:MAG: sigma-54 dependent transcriptional regulator [Pseudomonadales bacterium]|nr:sigma-54 dependent transcriptional regulator [Pseudomonadales bacterium]
MEHKILVVEDDLDLREAIVDTLEIEGYQVVQAGNGQEALQLLESETVALVVSDVNMPQMDGYQLLRKMSVKWPSLPVLIMTAYGSISNAVEAIRNGAVDYLEKPFETQKLIKAVGKFLPENDIQNSEEPVAVDSETRRVFQLAERVAQTDSTVLIMGESGTGKEVLARYIHRHSERSDKPFIAINCAAIPENMLEATLFGHEKGAFTGAHQSSPGKFEMANGGTLLLDEISEMDVNLQAKLLRVLQEKEVERIGGKKTISLDVRVLATTNRNLKEHVADGKFREDLYYRLNVFPLMWKPLRERKDDIVPLAERIIAEKHKDSDQPLVLDELAKQKLISHPWPGNIRELDNVMQRALILTHGPIIQEQDILILDDEAVTTTPISAPANCHPLFVSDDDIQDDGAGMLGEDLKKREFQLILDTLKSERGSKKNTAVKLGISPRTLRYKLAKMRENGIDVEVA